MYVDKHSSAREKTRKADEARRINTFNDTIFTAASAAFGALSAPPSAVIPSLASPYKDADETPKDAVYDREGPGETSDEIIDTASNKTSDKNSDAVDGEVIYASTLTTETFNQSPCLSELLSSLDASFSTTLLSLIDAKGMTDAQVYKRANMSRQLFSKIRSDALYKPTKKTVLALAIALELDLDATEDLLRRAGFALSHSNKADIIVEYFIMNNQFDIFEINATLYAFDQPLL